MKGVCTVVPTGLVTVGDRSERHCRVLQGLLFVQTGSLLWSDRSDRLVWPTGPTVLCSATWLSVLSNRFVQQVPGKLSGTTGATRPVGATGPTGYRDLVNAKIWTDCGQLIYKFSIEGWSYKS